VIFMFASVYTGGVCSEKKSVFGEYLMLRELNDGNKTKIT